MIAKLRGLATEARKALAAASGMAAELVSLGLLHGTAEKWTTGIIAAATSALVYLVPNGTRSEVKPGTAAK